MLRKLALCAVLAAMFMAVADIALHNASKGVVQRDWLVVVVAVAFYFLTEVIHLAHGGKR